MSAFLIGEYDRDDVFRRAEFAVADSVIYLGTRRTVERSIGFSPC